MSGCVRGCAGATLLLALSVIALPSRAADLPDWLAAAVSRPVPAWPAADAVVLHDEVMVIVPRQGRVVTTTRRAVRVARREGRESLRLGDAYSASTSAIKRANAWTILPDAAPVRHDRSELAERSLAGSGSLYTEARFLWFDPPEVVPGAIYAWESVIEEESLLDQWAWSCDGDQPVLLSRFTLTLPEGRAPVAVELGPRSFAATQAGATWSWSYNDEEWVPPEPFASRADRARASIAIDVPGGPAGARLGDWPAVARWLDGLMAPQARPTPEVARHAQELAGVTPDSLEQIRLLGRDVQRLNYVSINLGLDRGGGYRPHPASQVLATGYGDCKDKATLLAAMLASVGHAAWPLIVSAEGRDRVDERWPSPSQFNHVIVAIRAPDGSALPACFDHPQLGRLIAFDPTDPFTVFGDLPTVEQGAPALLVDAQYGGLLRLPALSPLREQTARTIRASLDSLGGLSVVFEEHTSGQAAVTERATHRQASPAEYRTILERWLAGAGSRIELGGVTALDDSVTGDFRLRVEYDAPYYARVVQGRMMLFRAAIVTPRESFDLPEGPRVRPIELESESLAESVTVELPPGFAVDEIPAAIQLAEDFGSFEARWSVRGSTLEFTRRWRIDRMTLPPERYPAVRALFAARAGAIEAPVVLVRR